MLCPLYIGEIGAPESRGALLTLEQLGIVCFYSHIVSVPKPHIMRQVLGVVVGFWFGFLTRSCTSTNVSFPVKGPELFKYRDLLPGGYLWASRFYQAFFLALAAFSCRPLLAF